MKCTRFFNTYNTFFSRPLRVAVCQVIKLADNNYLGKFRPKKLRAGGEINFIETSANRQVDMDH